MAGRTLHLPLGELAHLAGCVTRLDQVGVQPPETIVAKLGFRPDRLAQGYYISVLRQQVIANQVVLEGLTLRSGGRLGLPEADPKVDVKRTHNQVQARKDFGDAFVRKHQQDLADDPRNLHGSRRLVKISPVDQAVSDDPAHEFPMGSGVPSWRLRKPLLFFVAVRVDGDEVAHTAEGWTVPVAGAAPSEPRQRLRRYLDQV